MTENNLTILHLSDTHSRHRDLRNLPAADIIIHAGDVSAHGTESEVLDFICWFCGLDYEYRIFIAGNHDFYFEQKTTAQIRRMLSGNAHYLCDSGVEIGGVKFWGTPVSPRRNKVWAFNRVRGEELRRHWAFIPRDTDVLITHSPPAKILDLAADGEHTGCKDLLKTVRQINPRYHLFGHIHESYGTEKHGETTFVNASLMNDESKPINAPVTIEIEPKN
jgi:Icc-related predicted phosphoesterase